MVILWLSSSFGYYLIGYQLKYIKGDIYLNGIISTVSELVAYAFSGFIFSKLGFKNTVFIAYMIAIAGMDGLILY